MMSTVDIEYLRSWIGTEKVIADDLGLFPARALASVLDHDVLPDTGDALPPSWHWMYFLDTPSSSSTGADGHPKKGGFLPPVPLPRRMWAAGTLQIDRPLVLGCPGHRKSIIRSIELKEGKTGALVVITIEHALYQNDHLCILETQNLIYRDMPNDPTLLPRGDPAPTDVDWVKTVVPDSVLLFRFSALTYNGHRIHYDRDYAVKEEFYPALVVHGPLLATLLLDMVGVQVAHRRVEKFRFRAIRPIFDCAPFKVCGNHRGEQLNLWAVDHDGFIAMTASADLG